jgi:hypothetical protein
MRKLLFVLAFASLAATAQNLCDPNDTRVVISGVLSWQDPGVSSFSDENRKDQEFYDLLTINGVPDTCRTLLLDKSATLEKMKQAVRQEMKACSANSTFVFYYAGHGSKIGNDYYFCNYDMGSDVSSMFNVEVLYDLAAKHFKGKRIILMADCCYSGSLLGIGKKIHTDLGKEVIVLTSATSSNISTGNWTYTQTVLDDLRGDVYADYDGNGNITLTELANEIKQAMKYREYQLNGFAAYGVNADEIVISKTSASQDRMAGTRTGFIPGQYVYAYSGGKWRTARLMNVSGNNFTCQFYNYSEKEDVDLAMGNVREVYFPVYKVDQKVDVEWEGKWYPAKIMAVDDAFMYIHYEGYDNSYDEWVMYDRIWTGKEIEKTIEWEGSWYPGYVLEEKEGMYFITYKDDAHSWDEWVSDDRLK